MNNKYTQAHGMWESFDDLASRMDVMEAKGLNFLIQQQEMDRIRDAFAPLSRKYPQDKQVEFNFTKKEVKVSNLIMSAEGLTKFITDLQEMATAFKHAMNDNGGYKYDAEGNQIYLDIPVTERWVSLGDIKWNGEKFVVKVSDSTLDAMEKNNARKARAADYEAA